MMFSGIAAPHASNSTPRGLIASQAPPSRALLLLPPPPSRDTTVMGGSISHVNPVSDRFTLNVFGGSPVSILYDPRTRIYRNGKRVSTLHLGPTDHASVETALDGAKIYAVSIHILATLPQGETRGEVVRYNRRSGALELTAAISHRDISLRVPAHTPVSGVGQQNLTASAATPSALQRGTLVDVTFRGGSSDGQGTVTSIRVLATPGSSFVFTGAVQFIDISTGRMVIVDSQNHRSYQVWFDPSVFTIARRLHTHSDVRVTAQFDGSRYVASAISLE